MGHQIRQDGQRPPHVWFIAALAEFLFHGGAHENGDINQNAKTGARRGEALPNIGYYLKRKMRGEHNLLFGLTNDAFGYILTKVDWGSFKRYDYVSRTCLGEMTGEIYMDEALKLVAESPAPEKLIQ